MVWDETEDDEMVEVDLNALKGKGKGKMAMMLQMMMMMKGKGKGMDFENMGQGSKGPPLSWKSQLQQAYAKTHKGILTKETLIYSTEQAETGFTSTLSCDKFEQIHSGEGSSQKAAEAAAAKAALEVEFPTFFKEAAAIHESQTQAAAESTVQDPARKLIPWRSQLQEAFARKHKTILTKGAISYETVKSEEDQRFFVSTVSSEQFTSSYTGAPGLSMKFAADNAAVKAMEAEFPADYKASSTPKTNKGFKAAKKKASKVEGDEPAGEKRKLVSEDPKSTLNTAMMMLHEGPIAKGDVEYTTAEEGGSTVATVTIKCLKPVQKFTGEAVEGTGAKNKKEAEGKAAEAAMAGLKQKIDAAQEVAAVKKAERDEKKQSEWKVLLAKKKEEKAAEKAKKATTKEEA